MHESWIILCIMGTIPWEKSFRNKISYKHRKTKIAILMGLVILGELSVSAYGIFLKILQKLFSQIGTKTRVDFLDGFSYKTLLFKLYSFLLIAKKIIRIIFLNLNYLNIISPC